MDIVRRVVRKLKRDIKIIKRKRQARRMGLVFVPPNFVFFPRLNEHSVVVDGGCGYLADLSVHLIERYGVTSFGIDPTVKHGALLKQVEERTKGRFHHLRLAIASRDGSHRFFESRQMESGSLLEDHTNALRADVVSYDVEAVSLKTLASRLGAAKVDLLKLDLEGAEYDLFGGIDNGDLVLFDQVFIEFHHHAVGHFSEKDTRRVVDSLRDMGFQAFSLDDHNYLFFRA